MDRYIFGPIVDGYVHIMSYINGNFYLLKPDPNPNSPPYFGLNTVDTTGYSETFNIKRDGNSFYMENLQGYFFDFDLESGNVILSPRGNPYVTLDYTSDITEGTDLFFGVNLNIISNRGILEFNAKTPQEEKNNFLNPFDPDYDPEYFYKTGTIFLIPVTAYYEGICNQYNNAVIYSYTDDDSYKIIYYSNLEFCENTGDMKPCRGGNLCGQGNCIGPCGDADMDCVPRDGLALCGTEGEYDTSEGMTTWMVILFSILIVILLASIVFLIFKLTNRRNVKNIYTIVQNDNVHTVTPTVTDTSDTTAISNMLNIIIPDSMNSI